MAIKFDELLEALNPSLDEYIDESLNESSQNKRDEFFRYCLSNDMDYELICDILVDNLDDTTLSSIMKDIEEYNDFTIDESLNEAFNINDSFKFNSDRDVIDFITELENYFIKKGINIYSYYDKASNSWKINIDKKEFVLTISDPVFHLYNINSSRSLHDWRNMDYDDLLEDCIHAIESNL